MKFKVSTNIKSILGKDLISDKYIAIFELVKNACDAGAEKIDIEFIATKNNVSKIIITDDGYGMTADDLQNKWLFMAYSEKRHGAMKNKYAGSKGIGRFSCDRLGKVLLLKTKKASQKKAEQLLIDWQLFENDDTKKVEEIDLDHQEISADIFQKGQGTILEISNLRETWERPDLLKLRAALMKLVSPDRVENQKQATISIIAEHEQAGDEVILKKDKYGATNTGYGNLIVNGPIENDVFERLGLKTTSVTVNISESGDEIETRIEDRGSFVFKILRRNTTYDKLENIKIKLFYLNRSAKVNFTRIMGVESVNYGSIFIYKNGFRVYPYGTTGQDFFGINERKAQGYNRYLGTRELMGRILIDGENDKFVEKSSRDGGFIENPATLQLQDFFIVEVVRVLEKYVVEGIDWGDPERREFVEGVNEQGLMPIDVADKILMQFANLTKRGDIINAEINPDIVKRAKPQEDALQKSIKGLEILANVSQSDEIKNLIVDVKKEAEELRKQKIVAEQNADAATETLRQRDAELKIRERQAQSYQRKLNINSSQYEDALHIIYAISDAVKTNVEKIARLIEKNNPQLVRLVSDTMGDVQRIYKLSDLSINYDYGISPKKPKDLVEFIRKYVRDVWAQKINIEITTSKLYWKLVCNFDTSKISLIIDNIITNSRKKKAKKISIYIDKIDEYIIMKFSDDGTGLDPSIKNAESIFERGYSTTFGLGLGLYHTKQIIESMGGTIQYDENVKQGFTLEARIKYEYRF